MLLICVSSSVFLAQKKAEELQVSQDRLADADAMMKTLKVQNAVLKEENKTAAKEAARALKDAGKVSPMPKPKSNH